MAMIKILLSVLSLLAVACTVHVQAFVPSQHSHDGPTACLARKVSDGNGLSSRLSPNLPHKDLAPKLKAALVSNPLKTVGAVALSLSLLLSNPLVSVAESSRVVGQLQGSGLVFKDTLEIESFDDPKVQGVTLYISNFQRPITERLTSNFLQDPSTSSVACAKTGKVKIADNIAMGKNGEEVFEENKSLLFKTLRVQRVYDKEKNTVVYVSFNTRLDKSDDSNKSRFKSSVCAVALD